jgi:hypothetical protein
MFAVNIKDNVDSINAPIHDMHLFLVQTNDEFFSKFIRIYMFQFMFNGSNKHRKGV